MDLGEPSVLIQAATKREGKEQVPGTLTVTETKLGWAPSDPNAAQAILLERQAITSESPAVGGAGRGGAGGRAGGRAGGGRRAGAALGQGPHACWPPLPKEGRPCCDLLLRLAAGTQRAPSQPFIKLDTAAGPLVLGFASLEERDAVVDVLAAQARPYVFFLLFFFFFFKAPSRGAGTPRAPCGRAGSAGASHVLGFLSLFTQLFFFLPTETPRLPCGRAGGRRWVRGSCAAGCCFVSRSRCCSWPRLMALHAQAQVQAGDSLLPAFSTRCSLASGIFTNRLFQWLPSWQR